LGKRRAQGNPKKGQPKLPNNPGWNERQRKLQVEKDGKWLRLNPIG